eukprot:m.193020 g.193020  ORF g.193020 m.193020 type:complete len:545 (-) comp18792_c0_seq1:123-1757(-)
MTRTGQQSVAMPSIPRADWTQRRTQQCHYGHAATLICVLMACSGLSSRPLGGVNAGVQTVSTVLCPEAPETPPTTHDHALDARSNGPGDRQTSDSPTYRRNNEGVDRQTNNVIQHIHVDDTGRSVETQSDVADANNDTTGLGGPAPPPPHRIPAVGLAVGGTVCCETVGGDNPMVPWERHFLLELASLGPDGPCLCRAVGRGGARQDVAAHRIHTAHPTAVTDDDGRPVSDVNTVAVRRLGHVDLAAVPWRVGIVSVLVVDYPHLVPVETVRNTLKGFHYTFHPHTLVLLGDEGCIATDDHVANIVYGMGFTTVLRQYACGGGASRRLRGGERIVTIPLGYGTDMMRPPEACVQRSQHLNHHHHHRWGSVDMAQGQLRTFNRSRPLRWAFMGTMRDNRREALDTFRNFTPNQIGQGTKSEVAFAYANADFVLSPRGNENLDCFRAYEASAFGSIPVVVGTPAEIAATFNGLGVLGGVAGTNSTPPWVFAPTWSKALATVRGMSVQEIVVRRRAVLEWWIASIRTLQHMVKSEGAGKVHMTTTSL